MFPPRAPTYVRRFLAATHMMANGMNNTRIHTIGSY